ncbi:MAG: 1-(5-phosphoribosyl)-5-[(5-phosphoribosylamino)methylideneamino]imidazole-4-carboxamide isomerase [Clostridiales bacterium]|nr:1-(5-phosphoribosyl)-5-[(5-phosphoribosylamino)methylideneamino]imidazole-4-carboxamide isomerase [Clostridiales bacterium]
MIIYPAIDILDGQAVRLLKGDYNEVTVYGKPKDLSKKLMNGGCRNLHIVDLNGARQAGDNRISIYDILTESPTFVQVGGGIRTLSQVVQYLEIGVSQIIIGTMAIKEPDLLQEIVNLYPENITVGVDAKNGFVAVEGWEEVSSVDAVSWIKQLESKGVKRIVYTDISKDGTLTGPNFEMYKKILKETSIEVIASGGISVLEDLIQLKEIGVHGVVVGKALYENRFTLEEALSC